MRKAGVLLPISAQMGEFGIGDFGQNSRFFLDFIRQIGFKIWQVLPITSIGAGNSPYSGISSYAGNPLLIDLYGLKDYLSDNDISSAKIDSPFRVDYDLVKTKKETALRLAFSRIGDGLKDKIEFFLKKNESWLIDYALFMALKRETNKEWYEWEQPIKYRKKEAIDNVLQSKKKEMEYYFFEQYIFYSQWEALKTYANNIGIEILGDIPIYVAYSSVDVWVNKDQFLLDDFLKPTSLSGVPPDYFSKNGQFWGNPLYDYRQMELDHYNWFIERLIHNLNLYDLLRIDHFRGLYEYWSIPAGATYATEGKWEKGPGLKIWKIPKIKNYLNKIIAEDLGIIDEEIIEYRKKVGFPGMRVIQFGFDGHSDNLHLPHNFESKAVAYTATHDNSPTLGWLYNLPTDVRNEVLEYFNFTQSDWGSGGRQGNSTKAIARSLISSVADTVILPMQDLCAYGDDTRINVPGVAEGNWIYRCTWSAYDDIDVDYYRRLILLYGRE